MTPASLDDGLVLRGLRGATTCDSNSVEGISGAVEALVTCLVERNALHADRIVSVTFSVTADLDACFPAAIARRQPGWDQVALLDCQQMAVQGDLARCIRLLAHAWLPSDQNPCHAYLGEASRLRPDRSSHN
ncbi:MAG: chorismate mutase [Synechococcus sp.]|nr:chorismate mutase [Synechococcus sp.]